MSITAKEIAQLAGVSRGTVDRALKNRSGISAETKQMILDIAKKYDYKPNIIGKALVYSGKSIRVPVILNSIGNPFFDDVKEGISAAQEDFAGYGFCTELYEFKGYDYRQLLKILKEIPKDVQQIILTPISHPEVRKKINEMVERGVRVVMLSGYLDGVSGAVYVGCDYFKSGRVAGRMAGLISQGSANLFIMTGSAQHIGHSQRVSGICTIIKNDYPQIKLIGVSENNDDDKTAYRIMKAELKAHPEIDFIYITAGGVNGALRAVKEHKGNIRVCTFDDTAVTREAMLGGSVLSTICQQPFQQGYQSLKALFDMIIMKKEVEGPIYTELFVKVDESL